MTNLGDLLGNMADKLAQDNLNVGDVHLLNLDQKNGITPKAGDATRNKFFIILGFDNEGNVIGGLVINSNINYNLPATVTDYQLPVTVEQFSFLEHYNTPRFSDRHNYGGMTRNRYICKKEENQNGKTI